MRRFLASGLVALAACGGQEIFVERPKSGASLPYGSPSKIMSFLDSKNLVMEGDAIPSHPNGFDQHTNFGQATQCYHKVVMKMLAGKFNIVSQLGTLNNAPSPGNRGECNRDEMTAELSFDSTAVLIENVKGNAECFDITVTFPGFGQEGRGSLSEDGKTLVLELFFKDQATGHRCAAGNVGDATVTLNQNPFTGDARQTYSVE